MARRGSAEMYQTAGQGKQRASRDRVRTLRRAHPAEWCAAILVLLLLTFAIVLWAQSPAAGVDTSRTIRVEQGDTLWSIAASNPVPGLSTAETAEVIRGINDMQVSSLGAGDRLLVPVAVGGGGFVASR